MKENFPELWEEVLIQTQEAFRIPNGGEGGTTMGDKEKRTSLDHVITKTLNIQNKV